MPLDNNAKIDDIKMSLEGMQAINQKAELASVIGAPATASDNVATQITKLQSAKNTLATKIGVPNTTPLQKIAETLVVGKSYAMGTSTDATIIVRALPFEPAIVIVKQIDSVENRGLSIYADTTKLGTSTAINLSVRNTSSLYSAFTTIYEDGFSIQTANTNSVWIAIE